MPSVNVPGVGKVNFPDGMSQADIINAIERDILPSVKQKEEAPPPPPSAGFSLADTATALKQGVVGSAKALTDVFGAENVVSKKLGDIQNQLGEEYTPARKAEMARRADLQQQAAKTGTVGDEISTFLAGVAEAPVQSLAQGLGSIVPYVGTGIVGAVGRLTAPVVRALNTVVGAAQGAGSVKGSLYDNVKNELVKSGLSEQEADAKAKQAQEYLGANFLDIMGGTALGGVAARFGVENLLTPGASAKLSSNLVGRMTKAAAAEAPLEGVQAGQEQLAVNRGLQKEGFNVGTFEGVAGAAARDAAVGALVGSAVGIRGPGAPEVKPDANKTIADEDKSQEVKNQEATLQNQAPPPVVDSELELQLNPVINSAGDLLQKDMAPPPAPTATPTPALTYTDLPSYLAAVDAGLQIKQSDYRKLAKEAGITIPVGTKNVDAIAMLKAKLAEGGKDVTKPIDTTAGGVGAEVLGGPPPGGAPAGATVDGRPGVVSAEGAISPAEDGARAQQPALEPSGKEDLETLKKLTKRLKAAEKAERRAEDLSENSKEKIALRKAQDELDEFIKESEPRRAKRYKEITGEDYYAQPEQDLAAQSRAALEESKIGPPVRNEAFPTTNLAEYEAGLKRDQEQAAAAEAERQAALEQIAGENIPQPKTDADIREQYEKTRVKLKEQGVTVPQWKDLTLDERDKYLATLPADAVLADYDNAAKALAAYKEQKKGSGLKPAEQRIVNGYEESRKAYQRALVIDLPAWGELSPEAQSAYTSRVKNNTPVEQDAGFDAVAAQLEKEGKGLRGVSREGVRNLQLKGTEEVSKVTAAERIAKEAAAEASAQGKGEAISEATKAKLIAGDINGVLSDLITSAEGLKTLRPERGDKTYRQAYAHLAKLRKRATALTFRILANSLNKLRFTSTVVTDPNNATIQRLEKEGKLAEYDPKTDTFYFTPGGFDEATVLHEIVHAGTVKIINQFLTDPSKLTAEQREAAEHLQKIYDFSKKRLGNRFKNAYENLYEFVSYALTDNKFQIALSEMQVRPLAKYTGRAMELWKQFTQALSKMFGLYSAKSEVNELTAEMYQQVAKEYSSMDPDELYQNAVLDEIESLELGSITAPSLAGEGKETEIKAKKQKTVKQARKFLTTFPGYEGNLLLEMSEIFGRVLAAPEAGIEVAPLAAKKAGAEPKKPLELRDDEEIMPTPGKESAYALSEEHQPRDFKYIKNLFFTKEGWRRVATALQNERYPIKRWQDLNDLANKTIYEGKNKINNIYDQLTLSTSRAKNIFNEFVEGTYEKLNTAVYELSKTTGMEMKDVMDMLHRIAEALHDPERRLAKYVMTVPLSTIKDIPQGGTMISAADRRAQIMKILNTKTITDAQARALRSELNTIVFTTDANGKQIPNTKYVTPAGFSPSGKKTVDPTHEDYNATGVSPKAAGAKRLKYEALDPKIKALVDDVFAQVKELHRVTTDLNKAANYWSQPVSNRVAFYGFENYVPLKGVDKHSEADEMMDFDSAKMGKELQEVAHGFDGRVSVSDNPILQSMSDAVRAAMRAGRKELTQAIKNSVGKSTKTVDGKKVDLNPDGQGLLEGEVLQRITFEERQDENILKALPKENTIFHYNEDGSIDVIAIRDKSLREAIRRTYKDTNSLTNVANKITSSLGMMHTRYNYNFAPLNFVRDALTNAWAIGAEMGPGEAARFITQIANKVVTGNSLGKGMKIARLYETKDYTKIRELAKKDPIYKEMVEFIEEGGMVQYLQGISLKSNAEKLYKEVGRGGVIKTWDQFNRLVDIWTDMFELASRSAAYAIAKKNFRDHGATETAAKVRAAAYAKNLANFEQVGKYGREMGAAFMFFRPSATGAVRAIEAVAPAFQNLDKVVAALPERISKDPAALAEFKANYAARQKAARYMTLALGGAGALAYYMAIMAADEDDLGRNKVMNDDMSQWTRFARFYIPGFENPLQVPWGFGLGAFASGGAQLAGVMSGQQSIGDALGNFATQIMLDSFVPIPVSRMPISDNPAAWIADSLTPSTLRPLVEFVMNKNGLGQDIYNDSNRRMGDAYLGSDHIPETYKILATNLFESSAGSIDISPNTLYFLANSYIDGPARVVDAIVNASYLIGGTKEFKAKTDLPLVGSFIGAVPNVDSREFKKLEAKIEEKQRKLAAAETKPELYSKILADDPFIEAVVEIYKDTVGSQLKDLREEANRIRRDQNLTPKDKSEMLKVNALSQNIIKYNMKQTYEAYGLKP
jgi:hypothetical protein